MEEPKKALNLATPISSKTASSTSAQLKQRESQELVIAFSGPVGSGVNQVTALTQEILEDIGYEVVIIKVSTIIEEASEKFLAQTIKFSGPNGEERYNKLQTAGDALRYNLQTEILSELAIRDIITHRKAKQAESEGCTKTPIKEFVPPKTAYLIDQLKHPDEVSLLRIVYGNLFYLVGVLASRDQRLLALKGEGLNEAKASSVMERDRKEDIKHGQQLEKTLHLADYFIRNSHANNSILKTRIARLIKLIHGENGITPTNDEYGMYVAYAAGLKSACLSRQVGAAIADTKGNIISSGCNDVPRANGGLYGYDCELDNRCVHKGHCFNDQYKETLRKEVSILLQRELEIDVAKADLVATTIKASTRLSDLIEFSRAVHAEMDAITSVARIGMGSVNGATLYSTTFPCHNCARHIIASGISKVVYIEPYEKSLALELHGDDIALDPAESSSGGRKVKFLHFEGVSPRQYQNFFLPKNERKSNGGAVSLPLRSSSKISPEYLDSYMDFELKVLQNIDRLSGKKEISSD